MTMTTDMKMLIATAVLALFHFAPYFIAYIKHWGITGIVSNRENMPDLPAWARRALAAHGNMTENFAHFAVLVIAAHLLGASNDMTALGAIIFFWSRVVYWVVFVAGIIWLRTLAFLGGFAGEVIILLQLF